MKEKPLSLEKALELAQVQEAVEAAQRRLQGKQAVPGKEAAETNALQGPTTQQSSAQLQDLACQVRQLTDAVVRLSTRSGDYDGRRTRPWQQRGRGPPVCWDAESVAT